MIVKIRATGEHLLELIPRINDSGKEQVNEHNARVIEHWEHAWSLVDVYGKVWALVGILPLDQSPSPRWEAWMMIDPEAGKHMVGITRIVQDYFKHFQAKEIEANVLASFDRGHRYVRMLGFKEKTPVGKRDLREGQEGYTHYTLTL